MLPARYRVGSFPPSTLDWQALVPLIGPAYAAVAEFGGTLHGIPNTGVLLSPLSVQEAVFSNRIEGTISTLSGVLTYEAGGRTAEGTSAADFQEVVNYRAALSEALDTLDRIPLSLRLIRDAQRTLMRGVRGRDKAPGEFRRMPNDTWIGPPGSTVETARYVPCPVERLPAALDVWERFIHEDVPDPLVQLALLHAEFEAIHPFLDGNGRAGRLIVPLFMYARGLLSFPHFYISEYLSLHRDEYYDRLLAVSRDEDWTGWCAFFLRTVTEQARMNQDKALGILALYHERKDWVAEKTHSQYGVRALDWIFGRPIFLTTDFVDGAGIPKPTSSRILRVLREGDMLRTVREASGRRAAILAFPELLDIAEG